MSNGTKNTDKNQQIHHTAHFLVKSFLMSKRSLKKIYSLNVNSIAILRYIADSIDIYYSKHKKFHTKIFQSQIAKQNHICLKTVWTCLKHLIKKKLIIYNAEQKTFHPGKVLNTYVTHTQPIEVRNTYVGHRSAYQIRTSDSSDFTDKRARSTNFKKNQKSRLAPVDSQSTTHQEKDYVKPVLNMTVDNEISECFKKLGMKRKSH